MIHEKPSSTHDLHDGGWAPFRITAGSLFLLAVVIMSLAVAGPARAAGVIPTDTEVISAQPDGASAFTPAAASPEEPASTEPATAITQSSATLNATVDPQGAEVTECKFEYGTTTTPYESSVPCTQSLSSLGSGSSAVPVSAPVTGLAANTVYHFRISAATATVASKGADVTFKTSIPPTVETDTASGASKTSAKLNGTVNPNGSEVTDCKFEYGTTTAYGASVPCSSPPGSGSSAVAVSASVTGLTAGTTYHFRISATNSAGTSSGSDKSFTTVAAASPTVVTDAASSITQTSATLNATVNPNGAEVTECKFEYGTNTSYGSSVPCSSPPGSGSSAVAVSAPVASLDANTTYHFRISATNSVSAGVASKGSDASLKTLANPSPTIVVDAASSIAQTSATLNATVDPNGTEVTECKFEYGPTESYGSSAPCSSRPGSGSSAVAVSAPVTGLVANTTYHYMVSAVNAGGIGKSSDETFTTPPEPTAAAPPGVGPSGGTPATPVGLPAPALGRTANVIRDAGQVLIRLPGARTFVALSATRQIPYGTLVEAAHGEISVVAAAPGGGAQTGEFFDGEFVLSQGTDGRVLATLSGGNFAVCPPAGRVAGARRAQTRSKFASRTHLVRRLWAEARGNFSTKGRYAGGIVHGAQWLTEDMCQGTLILATRERVEVTDLVRHRHLALQTGGIYTAKPR